MDEAVSDAARDPFLPDWIDAAAEEARSVALGMLHERGRETLLHADRPLGPFGAKIALAARLELIDSAVEQSLHNLRRVRNGFAHSTAAVRLADPPFCDRLRDSVAQARHNPLWQPMQLILDQHMAERAGCRQEEVDPGLQEFVLLITILVAFLETASRLLRPVKSSLSLSFEHGILHSKNTGQ